MSDSTQLALQRSLAEPGNIKRVEEDDAVRYKNVVMLAPGEWTDAKSRTTYYYSPEGIANSVDNWTDNNLHLNHDGQETVLADIGHVDADTVDVDEKGRMFGDIVFHRRTSTSKDAEELMKLAVETEGEQGLAGPSVEIVDTKDEYDSDRGMDETTEMVFSGLGLVTSPASRTVAFEEQMKALQSEQPDGVRLMHNYKDDACHDTTMSHDDFDERIRALRRNLQSDDDLNKLKSAIDQFMEDADGGALVDLMEWAQENLSEELAQVVANLTEEYASTLDEEELNDADASDLQSWASEQLETDEDGEEEEEESEESEDGEEEEEDDEDDNEQENEALEGVKDRLSEVEDALDSLPLDELTELSGITDDIQELSESLEDVDRDLSEMQDEPVNRGLTAEGEEDDEDRVMMEGSSRVDRDRVGKPGAL